MKMKTIAYILIIGSLATLIITNIVVERKIKNFNIQQEMFDSQKGKELIISYFEAKDSAIEVKSNTGNAFVFFFVIGIVILLFEKIKGIEKLNKKTF